MSVCSMIMIMISVRMFRNIKVYPCILLINYIEQKMVSPKYFSSCSEIVSASSENKDL